VVGWLVYGAVLGQNAAAQAGQHGYHAGGLQLTVQQMSWMSNDMTGQGPVQGDPSAPPDPSDTSAPGFAMDPSMMPGMQTANNNRLQFEVTLTNTTSSVQRYETSDFHVVGPGGKSWPELATAGQNTYATQADIQPNYAVTLSVYFDIPIGQSTGLSVVWSRSGDTVNIPISAKIRAPMSPMKNMP
jgi:hypothetical protein